MTTRRPRGAVAGVTGSRRQVRWLSPRDLLDEPVHLPTVGRMCEAQAVSDTDLRRVGGALALFWAGGQGPSRAQIQSALMIAGYDGPDEGNKQEFVQSAIAKSDDVTARIIIEELIGLLRESGHLDVCDGEDDSRRSSRIGRLRRALSAGGHSLTGDSYIEWGPLSIAATGPATTTATPTSSGSMLGAGSTQTPAPSRQVPHPEVTTPNLDLLVASLRRLGMGGARPLLRRRHNRAGLRVDDEYDVQDLVEGLLRCLYSDVRHEEPTPSSAGSSSRMDLHLREGSTAVEVKVTATGRGERQIKPELLVDINDYREHPRVEVLVAVIYDLAGTFENPVGFEHDLSGMRDGLDVRVVVVPWVGPRWAD